MFHQLTRDILAKVFLVELVRGINTALASSSHIGNMYHLLTDEVVVDFVSELSWEFAIELVTESATLNLGLDFGELLDALLSRTPRAQVTGAVVRTQIHAQLFELKF
jgi:hypothetical protein